MANKKSRTVEGVLKTLIREKSSPSGNPRYTMAILTDDEEIYHVTTRPDSDHAYGMTNHLDKRLRVDFSMYRNRFALDSLEELS